MAVNDLVIAEFEHRVAQLPGAVEAWKSATGAGLQALGRHRSQMLALGVMMDVLVERQRTSLEDLGRESDPGRFAEKHAQLLEEIAGANRLWRVFQGIFTQRLDDGLRKPLEIADSVASTAYAALLRKARVWQLVDENRLREPPLVSLEPAMGPETVSRGAAVGLLERAVKLHRTQRLPIPVQLLPVDQIGCVWLYTTLLHEVGHNVDQDLRIGAGLSGDTAARTAAALGHAGGRERAWSQWGEEVLADAIGVLLGGAGFAETMATLLLVLAPSQKNLEPLGPHPHPAVRVRLLTELLRSTGVAAWAPHADAIDARWSSLAKDAWVTPFVEDCRKVAPAVLNEPLDALGGRTLVDLAPDMAADAAQTAGLATYLETGKNPPAGQKFPARLVPPAAQLAVSAVAAPDPARLAEIHGRALTFFARIEQPKFLAAPAGRAAVVRRIAADIRFD